MTYHRAGWRYGKDRSPAWWVSYVNPKAPPIICCPERDRVILYTKSDVETVREVMLPWIGPFLLESTSLLTDVVMLLADYDPREATFFDLHSQLSEVVLCSLYRSTAGKMNVILANYQVRKLTLMNVDQMIDELIGILFERLIPFSANFVKINEYALKSESLSALRVLYQKYVDYFSKDQYVFLATMIKRIYPPERTSLWLTDV